MKQKRGPKPWGAWGLELRCRHERACQVRPHLDYACPIGRSSGASIRPAPRHVQINHGCPAPAWSLNKSASRTQACKTSIDLCLDTSRILNTDAPRRAALVRKPDRSECAPKSVAFQPNLRGVCIHKVAHRFVGKPLKAELADRELGSQFETIRG
jgi:hypothetical protein